MARVFKTPITIDIATGTAPFVVSSTTLVTNLNADLLDGYSTATANTANTIVLRDASGNFSANAITGTSFVKTSGTSSQFLKADGSVDSSTYIANTASYFAGHHPEGRVMYNAYLTNDMANARLRGATVSATQNGVAYSISNANWDAMFDGTASFFNISPTSGFTFPLVLTVSLPRTLTYGTWVGIGFGASSWRAASVKIEVFSLDSSSWVTVIDTASNTSEDVFSAVSGLTNGNATGINQIRYTLSNPNSTQLRIAHLWAYNFNSDMWSTTMMPRAGGAFYGSVTNTTIDPASVPLIAKAAASQTANITEWQNSSSTVLSSITSAGNFNTGQVRSGTTSGLAQLSVIAGAAGTIGAAIRGVASQSANLQEWQTSTPTTVAYVDPSGVISSNSYFNVNQTSGGIAAQGTYRLRFTNSLIGIGATSPPSVGLAGAGLYINNVTTAPTSNPTGGGVLYVDTGALKYIGTSGSAQNLVSADGTINFTGDVNASGYLKSNNSSGDEGGEIFLSKAVTNTTLNTGVTIDVYQNKLRFFEQGGTARGFYIDITTGGAGVGTNLAGGSFSGGTLTSDLVLAAGSASVEPLTFQANSATPTVTAGAWDYDGDKFYAVTSGTATGRLMVPARAWAYSNASATSATTTTSQSIFQAGARSLTLEANKAYYFKLYLTYTIGGTFGTPFAVQLVPTFSNAPQEINYGSQQFSSASVFNTRVTTTSATSVTATYSSTTTNQNLIVEGFFRSNATTGGTVEFKYQLSIPSPGGNCTMNAGSYQQIMKIGSGSAAPAIISGAWA